MKGVFVGVLLFIGFWIVWMTKEWLVNRNNNNQNKK